MRPQIESSQAAGPSTQVGADLPISPPVARVDVFDVLFDFTANYVAPSLPPYQRGPELTALSLVGGRTFFPGLGDPVGFTLHVCGAAD